MLRWTMIFLISALISALLGFGGMLNNDIPMARIFFYIFISLFFGSLVWSVDYRKAR